MSYSRKSEIAWCVVCSRRALSSVVQSVAVDWLTERGFTATRLTALRVRSRARRTQDVATGGDALRTRAEELRRRHPRFATSGVGAPPEAQTSRLFILLALDVCDSEVIWGEV